MNLHEHAVIEEYDKYAIFELTKIPTRGNLLLDGVIMKVGSRFTQGDLRNGNLKYKHTANEGMAKIAYDAFFFRVPINDKAVVDENTKYSKCLPVSGGPKGGEFKFPIIITVLPYPQELRNVEINIMEDQTVCLNKGHLFYSSDTKEVQQYFKKPDVQIEKGGNEAFYFWKRFAGDVSFENVSKNAPPSSDAHTWAYNAETRGIYNIKNTSNYTGMVTTRTSESFMMASTMSSNAADDDVIGMVVAYAEEDGVPTTISVVRSGGWNGTGASTLTWAIIQTKGNNRTILKNGSDTAKNLLGNTKGQAWDKLGYSRVEVKREGTKIIAKCSQFSGATNGAPNAVTAIDDSTTMEFTLPAPFNLPCQYGLSAMSQAGATFDDIEWAELPYPPADPPEPDPTLDPMFERFPITYTVSSKSSEASAEFLLNGKPMKPGDTFTNGDISNGLICVKGKNAGAGAEFFSFSACVNSVKCTSGTFKVKVTPWPYPKMEKNSATMEECSEITINDKNMLFTVEFGSTDSDIKITLNETQTAADNPDGRVEVIPKTFTMADVKAGTVRLKHACDTVVWTEKLTFDVCTNHNKCVSKPFYVKITPIPVEEEPAPDNIQVSEQGCVYKLNFYGVWAPVGDCGLWADLKGRVLPEPKNEPTGKILYVKHALPEPVTLVALPKPEKPTENKWFKSPVQLPAQPEPSDGCEPLPPEPTPAQLPTELQDYIIEMEAWGDYGAGPPLFDVIATQAVGGMKWIARDEPISDLKEHGQKGRQYFSWRVPAAVWGNGRDIVIDYVQNEPPGAATDRNMYLYWVKVNGKLYDFGGSGRYIDRADVERRGLNYDHCRWTISDDFPLPPYQLPAPVPAEKPDTVAKQKVPAKCFTDPKTGTKWITDQNGVYHPVGKPTDKLEDFDATPLIKTQPFLVEVEDLASVPAEWPGPVLHKPTNSVYTKVNDEYVHVKQPFTESYKLDEFQFIGANEFWLQHGATFDFFLFSNRFYVRFDIMGEYGHSIIEQSNPIIMDLGGSLVGSGASILGNRTNNYNNQNRTSRIPNAMGMWPRRYCQVVSPITTMWDGMIQNSTSMPYYHDRNNNGMNPYHHGTYLIKLAGTESYAGFVASQRPKLVPERWTGTKFWNPDTKKGFGLVKNQKVWHDMTTVWSHSGYGSAPSQMEGVRNNGYGTHTQAIAYGGIEFGTYNPWLHFESWKIPQNTAFNPPEAPRGWCNGMLTFLDYSSIYDSKEMRNGGPVESSPPRKDYTMEFKVRGYDIATGEEKFRTYRVHWNATGTNKKGQTKATTDATTTGLTGFLPPKPKTAVCYFDDFNVPGNCRILDDKGK